MNFEWDDNKDAENQRKHGLSFEEAAAVFRGIYFTSIDDREDYGEVREITTGTIAHEVVVVVVHTDRAGVCRIISARRANKQERKEYHDHCTQITR